MMNNPSFSFATDRFASLINTIDLRSISVTYIVALGGLLFFTTFIVSNIISYRRLSAFRGPFWATITQLWLFDKTVKGIVNTEMRKVSEEYGHFARIGPNLLVTDDLAFLRRTTAPRSGYTRGEWYDGVKLDPNLNNVISERDEAKHADIRARLANGYAGKDNPNLEGSIDNHVLDLVNLIENEYLTTEDRCPVMDWAVMAQYFTMDVLTDVAFSRPFGYLKENADLFGYINTVQQYMPVLELQANIPFVNTIMNNKLIKTLLAPAASDTFGMGKMMGVAKEVTKERFGPDRKDAQDMLGSFVRHGLTEAQTESEALMQIMVGTDSTATAIRCIFYHILTNSHVYTTLQHELDAALLGNTTLLSQPLHRPVIRDSEARQLPYLQACITEGLRIWPPVAALAYKKVPAGGEVLADGRFIPEGTNVGISTWALHRSRAVYGVDADLFRPERWLEASGEALAVMNRDMELVFGGGRYTCLGKTIAFLELNKVISEVFLRYNFSVYEPQKGFKSRCNGMFVQSKMNVIVQRRAAGKGGESA